MRFNGRELMFLAHHSADDTFDKQGILQIKEKQEGLFRKGEVYMERWVKLRGNMLFYFKGKDSKSEPIGIIVLERCIVELDPDEELPYSFVLRFEGDEKTQYLGAKSERERDKWIAALHIASYECMRLQLQSLREQIKMRTGRDPIDNPEPSTAPDSVTATKVEHRKPFLELCLSCGGLSKDSSGKPPNSFISISISTPPNHHWLPHAHTEIVEKSCDPFFLTTAAFSDPNAVTMNTKVRLVVYDVRERMTNTMTQLGTTSFTIMELLTAPAETLICKLSSAGYEQAGRVSVHAWQNSPVLSIQDMHPSLNSPEERSKKKKVPTATLR